MMSPSNHYLTKRPSSRTLVSPGSSRGLLRSPGAGGGGTMSSAGSVSGGLASPTTRPLSASSASFRASSRGPPSAAAAGAGGAALPAADMASQRDAMIAALEKARAGDASDLMTLSLAIAHAAAAKSAAPSRAAASPATTSPAATGAAGSGARPGGGTGGDSRDEAVAQSEIDELEGDIMHLKGLLAGGASYHHARTCTPTVSIPSRDSDAAFRRVLGAGTQGRDLGRHRRSTIPHCGAASR